MKNIYEYQDNFFEKENDRTLLKYAKKIKNHDEKVFKSGRLHKKEWKVKCIVRRIPKRKKGKYQLVYRVWEKEIINELGKKEKIYKTPVYEEFNINKYEQIDKPLKLSYIEKSYDNMNYRQIRDYYPDAKISIRTIGSIINNFEKNI